MRVGYVCGMKKILPRAAYCISFATGILLIFIGFRFLLDPTTAEAAFGIQVPTHGNYSFHYIKGIRDLAVGLLTIVLLLTKEFRALGWMMLCMTIIPTTDLLIVLNSAGHQTDKLYAHLTAVIICLGMGGYYLGRRALKL
jgi:hypothetical protein